MHNQIRGRVLAEANHTPSGPARALQEHAERVELATLYHGMPAKGRIAQTGARASRFYEAAPGTAKRNPCADLVADARAAIATGASKAQVRAPFERMLAIVDAEFDRANPLPSAIALELAETKEQGEADYAVRRYLAEPDDSPHKAALADLAIRELTEHLTLGAQLRDRIRTDRVLRLPARRPRLLG